MFEDNDFHLALKIDSIDEEIRDKKIFNLTGFLEY